MTAAALLAALALGIAHSPAPPQNCTYTIPVIAASPGPVMAGNLRTTDGGCIVFAAADKFLGKAASYTRRDACKAAMHEVLHLAGWPHSPDPMSLMFSPYRPEPMPPPCLGVRRSQ